ncbi:MAG: bifunctional [glutamate--ammonia ligase]-adenylyl-L-tyrosine phosphorylase/[glutamate--ammonia-ligase] adenylyltransferase, partial [Alphaproteobacteria bacterium]|nr:bifunctional [glutamate--ammonia ligase]-adenylyl-L-tyrosine phosphorylase/[glutamate--ammonia-ligase] adenylyltransferase [Alphaproteobacteria bacterium]
AAAFAGSPFLGQLLLKEQAAAHRLFGVSPRAALAAVLADLEAAAQAAWHEVPDPGNLPAAGDAIGVALRVARRRAALVIGLADLAGLWPLEEVTRALSAVADRALDIAAAHGLRGARALGELAPPEVAGSDGGGAAAAQGARTSGYLLLAMGKLGGGELNYSSDIDLIALYDEERAALTGKRYPVEVFGRVTRSLVALLEERTDQGYVFRTDLRLRPDPTATPVCPSRTAAELYYGSMGQNWERAAMIKARPCAADIDAGRDFLAAIRPFVWRKHLDFAAIQDIHSIKRQIDAHRGSGAIKGPGHDLKIGRGGIREIEFYAQTQQLIWGGRDPRLRVPSTCAALRALADVGRVAKADAERLVEAYRFLRAAEHRVQMVEDQQTHRVPDDAQAIDNLAALMGMREGGAFLDALNGHLRAVEERYAALFEAEPSLSIAVPGNGAGGAGGGTGAGGGGGAGGATGSGDGRANLVFAGPEDDPETVKALARLGYADPKSVTAAVRAWHHGRLRATRSERARQVLNDLVPVLLAAFARTADPDAAFRGFDALLGRVSAGVHLLSLLLRNAALVDTLARILGTAPRLAEILTRAPILLDGLLAAGIGSAIPAGPALAADLETALKGARDFQDVLDIARRWAADRRFQIGAAMLSGAIGGGQAGAAFAAVADAALAQLAAPVAAELAEAHGSVPGGGLAVVGFGRLGSRDMSFGSDLDLVFVYDAPGLDEAGTSLESDGAKPLPGSLYFIRLAQRFVSAVTAPTGEGVLYEVDLRLKPSGEKGPAATSLAGFRRYYEEAAWTWEFMALTRARVVCGPPGLAAALSALIRAQLCRPRDAAKLRQDVATMRAKLAAGHPGKAPWDFKRMPGGITDVEFAVQYLQLRHAAERPEILAGRAVPALARLAEAGLVTAEDAAALTRAARLWRRMQGLVRLTVGDGFDMAQAPKGLRDLLCRAGADLGALPAGSTDFAALEAALAATAADVHARWRRIIGA